MILCNGVPKAGTHLLMSYCRALGMRVYPETVKGYGPDVQGLPANPKAHSCCHGHVPARHAESLSSHRVVTIFRHPRDVLLSYCRYMHETPREGLAHYFSGKGFVELYWQFVPWLRLGKCVFFERLPKTNRGPTYTGDPTRWQDRWTPSLDALWHEHGGPELETALGY